MHIIPNLASHTIIMMSFHRHLHNGISTKRRRPEPQYFGHVSDRQKFLRVGQ